MTSIRPWTAALGASLALQAGAQAPHAHPAQPDPHAHHRMAKPTEEPADPPSTDSLYQLTSRWTDSQGRQLPFTSLRGQPVVLVMFYASCEAICPLLLKDAQRIERALTPAQRAQVRFVAVSFDPQRDTPAKLAAYAKQRGLDAARWTLLQGEEDDVEELAAVLGMRFRPTGTGDFVHTNLITVLGPDGVVRARQVGLGQSVEPAVTVLTGLLEKKK